MKRWLTVSVMLGGVILLAGPFISGLPALAQRGDDRAGESSPSASPSPDSEAEEASEEDDDVVRLEYAKELAYNATQEVYYLSGDVVFSHQDIKLYCDEAWYNEADDTARATGHLKIVGPESTITGDLATTDFDAEITTVVGNVTVITQKKQDENSEVEESPEEEEKPSKFEEYREKKTTITCPKIVYEYADDVKRVTFPGPVKAVQEDKTAWADKAVYEEIEDIVTLTGNVRVKTEKGEEFRSPQVVISVEDEWMRATDVTGITFRKKKEE